MVVNLCHAIQSRELERGVFLFYRIVQLGSDISISSSMYLYMKWAVQSPIWQNEQSSMH